MQTLLLIAIFLPLLGAAVLWVVQPLGRDAVRYTALAVTLLTLLVVVAACLGYVEEVGTNPLAARHGVGVTDYPWLGPSNVLLDVKFAIALDGLGVWMFGL